ncbi:MAG: ABC transporter permease [Bacteroidota bacterium]
MLSNYIKIAIRQLLKNKTFSLINIFGLSVGVACCVLLTMFIQDEFSYEKHFSDHERIYRIYTSFKDNTENQFPAVSPPIATQLGDLLPEVDVATRAVMPPDVTQHLVRYKDNQFFEKSALLVDSTFFDVFDYEFKEGNRETALDAPATVVITEDLSKKLFGNESGIDELLIINSGRSVDTFRVSGVLKKDPTKKSHTDVSFFMSMNSRGWGEFVRQEDTWAWNNFVSGYLKLKPGTDIKAVEAKMNQILQQRAGETLKNAGIQKSLGLQPLDDIRLHSNFKNTFGENRGGNITYIYILASIGVFILLIACINFMNLTTAKAAQRAGEVGIRKSMGAYRSHLIRQFLGESFTIVAVSLVLAVVIMYVALPIMNNVTNKQLTFANSNIWLIIGALLAVGIVTGLVAGSYPAFFLSSFEPARVLKGKNLSSDGSSALRRGLVVFQFVITITLISSIFIIQEQLSFIRNKPLGFKYDNTIMVPMRTKDASNLYNTLKLEYSRIPGVKMVSGTNSLPSTPQFQDWLMYPEGSSYDKALISRAINVGEHYFETMGIELKAGRELLYPADTFSFEFQNYNRVLINEAGLKTYGIDPDKAIGAKLYGDWDEGKRKRTHEIVGVIKDYHHYSLHMPIVSTIYIMPAVNEGYTYLVASTEGGDYQAITAQMKEIWDRTILTTPFESQPLTASVEKQYEDDARVNTMLSISTALAIIISCMGLYGLSIFVAERKIKEIGIRKVLGASVPSIVTMLSKDFIKLVAISFVVAVPIGWYLMTQWLKSFEYKIELGLMVFVLAGLVSFAIAWVTIGFESVKAALGNPVNALRSE